jgi:hypothetical protein
MMLVLFEERANLRAKALGAARHDEAGKLDGLALPYLIEEVGEDQRALLFLHQLHQPTQTSAQDLEHRHGNIGPPALLLDLLDEGQLLLHHRNAGLRFQRGGQFHHRIAEPGEASAASQ